MGHEVFIYYFDNIIEVKPNCFTKQINFKEKVDFNKYDIVHSHMLRPDKYVAKNKIDNGKTKYISTIHCNIFDDLSSSYGFLISVIYIYIMEKLFKKNGLHSSNS